MDKGFIEIGNINTPASAGVIRRLKSILDQHGIFHIIGGVMFYHPHLKTARREVIHPGRVREENTTKDDFREKYRELIVPDLYNLNFMSIVYFDTEEADFLATLIYGEN